MSELDELFRDEINSQGFGFQFAIVQAIERHRESTWAVAATEFPVAYRGRATHIDVLAWCHGRKGMLVGECKRVNPALGYWVFARSPFTFDERSFDSGWLEHLTPPTDNNIVARTIARPLPAGIRPYHIALEVKNAKEDGDRAGLPKGRAFSQALTQIDEGVNGLIEMFPAQKTILKKNGPILFLPVIFTTATLYATDDAELNLSDLATGHIPPSSFERKDWLWFEHNISPDLLHQLQRAGQNAATLTAHLETRHTRSIAIVSASGVSKFLRGVADLMHRLLYR